MNTRKYLIYIHVNKLNNKIYIGQTCQSAKERWQYGGGYRHNKHFYAAIKKYGWDNFEHKIIAENLTKEQADELESQLIMKYESYKEMFGYNVKLGGANNTIYATEEEAKLSRKKIQHTSYKRMIANKDYAQKMREKSLEVYYNNKTNKAYMEARSLSNHKSRAKVHQIRLELKKYYTEYPDVFTVKEIDLAFSYKNGKSYNCNSSKKLLDLLKVIEDKVNEKRKSEN